MEIHERGFWESPLYEGHGTDAKLADALYDWYSSIAVMLDGISIIDVGCGNGYYTKLLNRHSRIICRGYDGNPHTAQVENCGVFDFTTDASPYLDPFDFVLCLEVGEHIPAKYEDVFIQNLHTLNRYGMILSWAVPGQGGDGHVNCRSNEYIREKICNLGYKYDVNNTNWFRSCASPYPKTGYWFKNTLMVFTKI